MKNKLQIRINSASFNVRLYDDEANFVMIAVIFNPDIIERVVLQVIQENYSVFYHDIYVAEGY